MKFPRVFWLVGVSGLSVSVVLLASFHVQGQLRAENERTNKDSRKPRLVTWLGHSSSINSVAFSPDGRYVLTASSDNSAFLWEKETGRVVQRYIGHSDAVVSAIISPNGHFVLTGSNDGTARVWDLSSGEEIRKFDGGDGGIHSAAFSPDSSLVLTGSDDGIARVWKVESGHKVQRLEKGDSRVTSVAFSPNGLFVMTGSDDGIARLWELNSGREIHMFGQEVRKSEERGNDIAIRSIAYSPDGRYVLTGGGGNTRLWEIESGQEIRRFEGHQVAFGSDNRFILTGDYRIVRLWELHTGREVRRFSVRFAKNVDYISSIGYSTDGRLLLIGSFLGPVHLLDVESGRELRQFEGIGDSIGMIAFSLLGKAVLAGREWSELNLTNGVRASSNQYEGYIIACSSDGKYLLTRLGIGKNVVLYEVDTGRELRRLELASVVYKATFSPNGQYVLTGGGLGIAQL